MPQGPIRVVIIASTQLLAEGIASAMALIPDCPFVFKISTPVLDPSGGPGVSDDECLFLLDVSFLRSPGPTAIPSHLPSGRLVVCGVNAATPHLALNSAAAVLASDAGTHELLQALRSVAAGVRYVSPVLEKRAALLQERRQRLFASAHLTKREQEIAQLLVTGLSNRRIAQALGISRETTKVHVRHVLRKRQIASRHHLSHRLDGEPPEAAGDNA